MAKIKRLEMEKANKAAAIAGMNLYKKAGIFTIIMVIHS